MNTKHKLQTARTISAFLAILCLISLFSCNQNGGDDTGLWNNAIYTEDTTLGDGASTVTVSVEAEGKTVIFTLKTDKKTLGEAMYEHNLINDPSFFDVCNGIKADWNADQAYWAFYMGETMMNAGVGDAEIKNGDSYRIVYTK